MPGPSRFASRLSSRSSARGIAPRRTPLALALASLAFVGAGAQAQPAAFSSGWFAAKNATQANTLATGRLPNGLPATSLPGGDRQAQAAREQLQRSVGNLGRTAASIAAQQAAQRAAREAALAAGGAVPDGLAEGGLKVDANPLTAGWRNARAPVQTAAAGRAKVTIEQTGDKAILNWETFNVGQRTTVEFRQDASWAVLNRVNDPKARPSVIQGQIQANGTVMIVNRNGVVFDGASQVNVRNLVAAAARITDAQFLDKGLYSADDNTPTFASALGKVELRPGSSIETNRPSSVTQSGGYVLLLGGEVDNAGTIATPRGQAALAAGDSFVIRRGQGTEGNVSSTTRGNEVLPSGDGIVRNRGLVLAPLGDITLAARQVEQAGVLAATTSVDARGTIHLNASGANGAVTLASAATTAILVDADGATALDGQRDNLMLPSVSGGPTLAPTDANRRELSLVQIQSSGAVDFQSGSLTLATGGQVAVKAAGRSLVRDSAQIDVSGAIGVAVAMESNNIKINLQGNEQRDSPLNRDSGLLTNSDVWLDRRDLIRVAAGSGGTDADRWYSGGGLLEVAGYLGNLAVPASHWLAQGGQVRFEGAEVVTQAGSAINLSGGTLDVQGGTLRQTWLRGEDGRLYVADRAPADMLYTGLYRGYEQRSERWGEQATRRFYNPLLAPATRYEDGYTVGRDAGALVVSTRSAVLEGTLVSDTYQGVRQDRAPQAGLDGYSQSQRAVARRAQLVVGNNLRYYDSVTRQVHYQLGATADTVAEVRLGTGQSRIADGLDLQAALPQDRAGKLFLDTDLLNGFGLGGLRIAASREIMVDGALRGADGGEITLYAPRIDVRADITSRSGLIQIGNVLLQPGTPGRIEEIAQAPAANSRAWLRILDGVTLDARGTWANLLRDGAGLTGLPTRDGGRVALRGTGDVIVEAGSVVDVSAGASVLPTGKLAGGKGGSVTLAANTMSQLGGSGGNLTLAGEVRGYGVTGGGTLSVVSGGRIVLGGEAGADATALRLDPSLFRSGFGRYEVNGHQGVTVADGAAIDVLMPVLRLEMGTAQAPGSGLAPADVLSLWTPPLYAEDPVRGRLTQRVGADLALSSDRNAVGGAILVGEGARVSVDAGRSLSLKGAGQITVLGRLEARGGLISLQDARLVEQPYAPTANPRSVWIGEHAVLDASGSSQVALDAQGRRYGVVQAGGAIEIGGRLDWEGNSYAGSRPIDAHLIVRPGAVLDASGAQAVLDLPGRGAVQVGGDGGRIVLASANSLHLDGSLRAAAGAAGAAGGTLGVSLGGAFYLRAASPALAVQAERLLTLVQYQGASALADGLLPGQASATLAYGNARLGVDRIAAGGFDNLALYASVRTEGDLDLAMGQSLRLTGTLSPYANAPAGSVVRLSAPYLRLNETAYAPLGGGDTLLQIAPRDLWRLQNGHRLALAADLLDVRGKHDMLGFEDVQVDVNGDLRLLAMADFSSLAWRSQLRAPHRMTVTAAQIYPGTGATGRLEVGTYQASSPSGNVTAYDPDAVLTLRRTAGTQPQAPDSVFGSISFAGARVEQGGVVRAPLGRIVFDNDLGPAGVVRFLPGSLTSISAQGLLMPYGGTVDGVKYLYGGQEVRPVGVEGDILGGLRREILLAVKRAEVDEGAVLDLSGGGELTGAAFVRGRGGSVDVLRHALADANPGFSFSNPGSAVYAIVPGYGAGYAPLAPDAGAGDPAVGRRVTLGAGVPGLPAGTYTLLPSTYALLPGAFRVELGAQGFADAPAARTRGGSWVASGWLGTRGTDQQAVLANRLLITPGDVVRRHAQYNETSYNRFVVADAARTGVMRAGLTVDAGTLQLALKAGAGMDGQAALRFAGSTRFGVPSDSGGYAGALVVTGPAAGLEILAPGQAPTLGAQAAAVSAADLNALAPAAMFLGASKINSAAGMRLSGPTGTLLVRSGVELSAPELFLYTSGSGRGIVVESGATLTTLGRGAVSRDARDGLYYVTDFGGVLALSNGLVNLLPVGDSAPAAIDVGACLANCAGSTRLLSEGSISAATNGAFTLRDSVLYGTRNLALSVSAVNLGSAEALARAGAAGKLPPGMGLNQNVLANLLRGNSALGAPALESLILTAGESVNVYGSVALDARGAGGRSLQRMVLGAPAIYGYGAAGDVATIAANEFIWAGSIPADRSGNVPLGSSKPQAPGGAILDQLGHGRLNIAADVIRLEASPLQLPSPMVAANRLALGFSAVTLDAARMITGSAKGGVAVYHEQDGYTAADGWRYRGGDLLIRTPLLTGEAGADLAFKAGGALRVTGTGAAPEARKALGASLSLSGGSVAVDTAVVLPSGKLAIKADGDIALGAGARIDLAGREVPLFDVARYSWGGDLELHSVAGNITLAAGSVVDLSARHNRGGRLQAIALGADAGRIDLAGAVLGSASGLYDAGGTLVPYDSAEIVLRAQSLVDFAGLNTRLNNGGVTGARRFQIKQGDLTVGDEVRARHVEIVLDGGSLTVNGRIDASGQQVGSIRLAARRDLIVNGLLDTHATGLRVDSYGQVIDSANRAIVDLTAREGTLTLGAGARVDLRAGTESPRQDGVARGTLDLNARRLGGGAERGAMAGSGDGANDVALVVAGAPSILGARTVAVNAFRRYDDAPLASAPDVNGKRPQEITQGYLDGIDRESQAFMNAALGNAALGARLAGLAGYRLRPGVEVTSAAADGDLSVVGDLDLSNHRYGPNADRFTPALRGYGEPGVLVLRAGGNLNLYGSINDGFAPPPDSPDDASGWKLVEGRLPTTPLTPVTPFGEDLVVPIGGISLEAGTRFPAGRALNYDLSAKAATLPAGTVLPVAMTLDAPVTLPAGLVLTGDVTAADGSVLRAGTVLANALALQAGAKLGAGFVLRSQAAMRAFIWPKGVALPAMLEAATRVTLAQGAIIPSQTRVVLLNGEPVNLRPQGPDGKQGRNWALAPMLGPGATAWDLTLVAGADLASADLRARNVLGTGDIVLADTHHGVAARAKETITTVFIGDLIITRQFVEDWGESESLIGRLAKEVAAEMGFGGEADLCGMSPAYCAPAPRRVSEAGSVRWHGDASWAGRTVDELAALLGKTADEVCVDASYCVGGKAETTITREYRYGFGSPAFSVLRTGAGDLTLLAGRDVAMTSMYGVYTAGAPTSLGARDADYNLARGHDGKFGGPLGMILDDHKYDAAMAAYRAWYPDGGGNLVVQAGRDIHGDAWARETLTAGKDDTLGGRAHYASATTGNWLWRQGVIGMPGVADIAPAWWINFGTYVSGGSVSEREPRLVGFTGFGTLGGGNVSISAGRDAGVRDARGDALAAQGGVVPRTQGLSAAVGGTGRLVDGKLVLTGGGDLDLRVGGSLNPGLRATQMSTLFTSGSGGGDNLDLNGVLVNLRGRLVLDAGQVGGLSPKFGDGAGLRAPDPFALAGGVPLGAPRLVLGDATAWIDTRGDLVLGAVSDPGRVAPLNSSPYLKAGATTATPGGAESWFTLWTPATAVNLFSAGGNLSPMSASNSLSLGSEVAAESPGGQAKANYYVYPSILRAVAAGGNIVLAPGVGNAATANTILLLAPSAGGQLELLSAGSILAQG
uniref:two-partner secretion domain-containing protein n=3 Tax=Pseudomonadati TaxID=3379134 RepID=UPI00359FB07F